MPILYYEFRQFVNTAALRTREVQQCREGTIIRCGSIIFTIAVKNNTVSGINIVVVCIGTMRVTGDSVGPRVGDILKESGAPCYVYGDSLSNINAHKLDVYENLLKVCHSGDIVIAVDAALGNSKDVGRVKVTGNGLRPGRALGRKNEKIGDIGVLAVVGQKCEDNFSQLAERSEDFACAMARKAADVTLSIVKYIRESIGEKYGQNMRYVTDIR